MDSLDDSSDEGLTSGFRVADTYGDIIGKMARDKDPARGEKLQELDGEVELQEKYSPFLFKYLYCARSSLERIYLPYDESDWSFKARVDLFVDADNRNDAHHVVAPHDTHLFSHKQFPGYNHENIVFLKFPYAMVQLWGQGDELSYLHAPSLVQHYAVAINNHCNAPILDLTAYVKSYQGRTVWRHIEGMTLESENTLRHLLLPDRKLLNSTNTAHHVVQYLREHHVGLVSRFRVFPEFKDPHCVHYHGSATKDKRGAIGAVGKEVDAVGDCRHSMCLVGFREVQRAGRPYYYFLLQNSWRHKQFIEVDQRYLSSTGAMVHFICEPQSEISGHLPTLRVESGGFIESAAGVGAGDGVTMEVSCDCCGF